MRQPKVFSVEETIKAIKDRKASIARYGDGEFDMIFGRKQGFQETNKVLAKKLKTILKKNNISDRFLVAVPDCFSSLEQFTANAQIHWKNRLDKERIKWVRCLNTKQPYYHSQITRFYFDWADKSKCGDWFKELKDIWNQQNVLIVEGELSRVGVGNDLFDNVKSLKRILCPSKNAFSFYEEILDAIVRIAKKDELVFIALGPTATVLAYDLFQKGFWAFDAGHIDIEYEWMKRGVDKKVIIEGKYVNEVKGGALVEPINNETYEKQIVVKIGCDR